MTCIVLWLRQNQTSIFSLHEIFVFWYSATFNYENLDFKNLPIFLIFTCFQILQKLRLLLRQPSLFVLNVQTSVLNFISSNRKTCVLHFISMMFVSLVNANNWWQYQKLEISKKKNFTGRLLWKTFYAKLQPLWCYFVEYESAFQKSTVVLNVVPAIESCSVWHLIILCQVSTQMVKDCQERESAYAIYWQLNRLANSMKKNRQSAFVKKLTPATSGIENERRSGGTSITTDVRQPWTDLYNYYLNIWLFVLIIWLFLLIIWL